MSALSMVSEARMAIDALAQAVVRKDRDDDLEMLASLAILPIGLWAEADPGSASAALAAGGEVRVPLVKAARRACLLERATIEFALRKAVGHEEALRGSPYLHAQPGVAADVQESVLAGLAARERFHRAVGVLAIAGHASDAGSTKALDRRLRAMVPNMAGLAYERAVLADGLPDPIAAGHWWYAQPAAGESIDEAGSDAAGSSQAALAAVAEWLAQRVVETERGSILHLDLAEYRELVDQPGGEALVRLLGDHVHLAAPAHAGIEPGLSLAAALITRPVASPSGAFEPAIEAVATWFHDQIALAAGAWQQMVLAARMSELIAAAVPEPGSVETRTPAVIAGLPALQGWRGDRTLEVTDLGLVVIGERQDQGDPGIVPHLPGCLVVPQATTVACQGPHGEPLPAARLWWIPFEAGGKPIDLRFRGGRKSSWQVVSVHWQPFGEPDAPALVTTLLGMGARAEAMKLWSAIAGKDTRKVLAGLAGLVERRKGK